MLLVER